MKEVTKALRKKEKGLDLLIACLISQSLRVCRRYLTDRRDHTHASAVRGGPRAVRVCAFQGGWLFWGRRWLIIQDLGAAGQTKRPTSVVFLKPTSEGYEELLDEVKALPSPF